MKTITFKRKPSRIYMALILAGVTLFSLSSCLKDSNNDGNQDELISGLTVINGAADAPSVDFTLNRNLVGSRNLSYGYRIPYWGVYAGEYSASFYKYGTNSNAIHTQNITLEKSKFYSLFLAGTNENLTTLFIEDDLTTPAEGKASVRFLNLSPDAGVLDFSMENDVKFASQKEFKAYTEFTEVAPGEYSATFKSSTGDLVNFPFTLKLEAGKIYTVWARGLVSSEIVKQGFENGLIIHNLQN